MVSVPLVSSAPVTPVVAVELLFVGGWLCVLWCLCVLCEWSSLGSMWVVVVVVVCWVVVLMVLEERKSPAESMVSMQMVMSVDQ